MSTKPENKGMPVLMPDCPNCRHHERVEFNLNLTKEGRFFCPCNEPGPETFDRPPMRERTTMKAQGSGVATLFNSPEVVSDRRLEQLNDCLAAQGALGNWNYDSYMHGYFNGIELGCAIMEGRDPDFRDAPDKFIGAKSLTINPSDGLLLELAWGVIANVSGGNWDTQGPEWKKVAQKFRDSYLAST